VPLLPQRTLSRLGSAGIPCMAAELEELERAAGIWCAVQGQAVNTRTVKSHTWHPAAAQHYVRRHVSESVCQSRDNDESEEEEDDEAHLCSVGVVDIKALETSCALAGGGSLPCTETAQDAVDVAPSSPSSCLETFSLPRGQTGTMPEFLESTLMTLIASRARFANNLPIKTCDALNAPQILGSCELLGKLVSSRWPRKALRSAAGEFATREYLLIVLSHMCCFHVKHVEAAIM